MTTEFDINILWPNLSQAARRRWWRETDYNKRPAPAELKQAMIDDAAAGYLDLGADHSKDK